MKNKIFIGSMVVVATIVIFFVACTEDKKAESQNSNLINNLYQKDSNDFDLNSRLTISNTTSIISSLFFKIGVTKIIVENDILGIKFKFNINRTFIINGESINFYNKEFILKNNLIYEKSNPKFFITSFENEPYIITPNEEGKLNSLDSLTNDNRIAILLLFLNEVTLANSVKLDYEIHVEDYNRLLGSSGGSGGGCSLSNTVYVVGIGLTQSASNANLDYCVTNSQNSGNLDCRRLGGTDVTNWGGCYTSTNTYCCDGTGGAVGSW